MKRPAAVDARAVADLLHALYGFEATVLLNAGRDEIMDALNPHRSQLTADSQFLIYYAGHGFRDAAVEKSYRLPVDASPSRNRKWISSDDVIANLKGMDANHVLIVSDSCSSGGPARTAAIDLSSPAAREAGLNAVETNRARLVMTSGGDEPVADAGPGGHSAFAAALLDALSRMKGKFTVQELFANYIQL